MIKNIQNGLIFFRPFYKFKGVFIMPIKIRIPTPLRDLTNGEGTVEVEGRTVSEVLINLESQHPVLRERLYERDTLRPSMNIYLNDEDIRSLNKIEGKYEIDVNTPVKDGDQLSIIPPVSGGLRDDNSLA